MSTSTAAAPPASMGVDGPEPVSVPEATGVLSPWGREDTGVRDGGRGVRRSAAGDGLPSVLFSAVGEGLSSARFSPLFAEAAAELSPPGSFASGNTTSEHE